MEEDVIRVRRVDATTASKDDESDRAPRRNPREAIVRRTNSTLAALEHIYVTVGAVKCEPDF